MSSSTGKDTNVKSSGELQKSNVRKIVDLFALKNET